MSRWESRTPSLLAVAGLFIILGILAVLQYKWTGELGEAERERMRRSAVESSRRLTADFDGRIVSAVSRLRPDPGLHQSVETQVADALDRMSEDDASLVREVWLVALGTGDEQPLRHERGSTGWVAAEPPQYIHSLETRAWNGGRGFRLQPLIPEGPAIVLPSGQPRAPDPDASAARGPGGGPSALIVVVLDRDELVTRLLPEFVTRHFGEDDVRAWSISVVDHHAGTTVYSTEDVPSGSTPDFEIPLLGINLGGVPQFSDRRPAEPMGRGPHRGPGGPPPAPREAPGHPPGQPPSAASWIVEVYHRDGTLQEIVERSRARNLALGGAVLVLLMAGGLITIRNAHRSRELASQQLEFVAAVTHELNTPIAAISSAGQNLADGVVMDSDQVRRYGTMIAREGRRLSTMVDHVLEFAGMQGSSYTIEKTPVTIDDLVAHALSTTAWLIEESGVSVETDIRGASRTVACDREALSRALANLVGNAIKYRGSSSRIDLSAHVDERKQELVLSVRDKGLGMTAEDRKQIFEPFVRGSNVREAAIRGSGLGLSIVRKIVEAHGGHVSVDSSPGRGSTFSIRIPVN